MKPVFSKSKKQFGLLFTNKMQVFKLKNKSLIRKAEMLDEPNVFFIAFDSLLLDDCTIEIAERSDLQDLHEMKASSATLSEFPLPAINNNQIGIGFSSLESLISSTIDTFIAVYDENSFQYPSSTEFASGLKAFVSVDHLLNRDPKVYPILMVKDSDLTVHSLEKQTSAYMRGTMSILKSSIMKVPPYSTQKERAPSSVSFKDIRDYNEVETPAAAAPFNAYSSFDTGCSVMSGYTTGSQSSEMSPVLLAATPLRDHRMDDSNSFAHDEPVFASGSSDDSTFYDALMELTPAKVENDEPFCDEAVRVEVAQSLSALVDSSIEIVEPITAPVVVNTADLYEEIESAPASATSSASIKHRISSVQDTFDSDSGKSHRRALIPTFDAHFRATFKTEWSTMKDKGWTLVWYKDYEVYCTPFSTMNPIDGVKLSATNVSEAQLAIRIENLQYFVTKEALLSHVAIHPWLYEPFPLLWDRLRVVGWERVDAPHSKADNVATIYQYGPMLEGYSRVMGVHQFVSMLSMMQYIARFPFLLQNDKQFSATLLRHHWEMDQEGVAFRWVDGDGNVSWLSVGEVKRRLWVMPHMMFQFYHDPAIPSDLVLSAVRLNEDVALASEKGVGSPLPKGMTVSIRNVRAAELHADLVRYHTANLEAAEDMKFFCHVSDEQKRLENALWDLNWLLNREETDEDYQKFFFVAPWTRSDLKRDPDFARSEARLGANCFYHLFDVAQLAVKFGPSILTHRVASSEEALISVALDLEKTEVDDLIRGAANLGTLFHHFSFLRMLQSTGWTIQSLGDVVDEEDVVNLKKTTKTLYIPYWGHNEGVTAENYQDHVLNTDYFLDEKGVEGHILDQHGNVKIFDETSHSVPMVRTIKSKIDSSNYLYQNRCYPIDSSEGYVVSLLLKFPAVEQQMVQYKVILSALKGVGWSERYTFEKTLIMGSVYCYYNVAPWAAGKYTEKANRTIAFLSDAVRNVDYFCVNDSKRDLLKVIAQRGFLSDERLANFPLAEKDFSCDEDEDDDECLPQVQPRGRVVVAVPVSVSTPSRGLKRKFSSGGSPHATHKTTTLSSESFDIDWSDDQRPTSKVAGLSFLGRPYEVDTAEGVVASLLTVTHPTIPQQTLNFASILGALKHVGWFTRFTYEKTAIGSEYFYYHIAPWAAEKFSVNKNKTIKFDSDAVRNTDYFHENDKKELLEYISEHGFLAPDYVSSPAAKVIPVDEVKVEEGENASSAEDEGMDLNCSPMSVSSTASLDSVVVHLGRSYSERTSGLKVVQLALLVSEDLCTVDLMLSRWGKFYDALKQVGWSAKWSADSKEQDLFLPPWTDQKTCISKASGGYVNLLNVNGLLLEGVDFFRSKEAVTRYVERRGFNERCITDYVDPEAVMMVTKKRKSKVSSTPSRKSVAPCPVTSSAEKQQRVMYARAKEEREEATALQHAEEEVSTRTHLGVVYETGSDFAILAAEINSWDKQNLPNDQETKKRFTFVYKYFLKSLGWRVVWDRLVDGVITDVFLPPWTAGDFRNVDTATTLVNIDYFTDRNAVLKYIQNRGFDKRQVEDFNVSASDRKAAATQESHIVMDLSAEDEDDEVKRPFVKNNRRPETGSLSKVSAHVTRRFEEGTHEHFLLSLLEDRFPTEEEQLVNFSAILSNLKKVGWVSRFQKGKSPLGDSVCNYFFVAPWALNKFTVASDKSVKFNSDAIQNVDYFREVDRMQLLQYITKNGFLAANYESVAPMEEEPLRDRKWRERTEKEEKYQHDLMVRSQSKAAARPITSSSSSVRSAAQKKGLSTAASPVEEDSDVEVDSESVRHGQVWVKGSLEHTVIEMLQQGTSGAKIFQKLEQMGWMGKRARFGAIVGLSDYAYFPPWALHQVPKKSGGTETDINYSLTLTEGLTYFVSRDDAVDYVIRRGFAQRTSDLSKKEAFPFNFAPEIAAAPVPAKKASASLSTAAKKPIASTSNVTSTVSAKPSFKSKVVTSAPKTANYRLFKGRKYLMGTPQSALVEQLVELYPSLDEQIKHFASIRSTLKEMGWRVVCYKLRNAVGTDYPEVILPTWSNVVVSTGVATIDRDVVENVDYFLSEKAVLTFLTDKGFEDAAVLEVTANAATDSYRLSHRSPERALYKATDPAHNYDRLATSGPSSPLVTDSKKQRRASSYLSDEDDIAEEAVDHGVSRLSTVRRSESFGARSSHDLVSAMAVDSDVEEDAVEEEEEEDIAAQVTNSAGQTHGKHTSTYYESVRKAQREVHASDDDFHPLHSLLQGANPNFEKVFRFLEGLNPKWTKRVINLSRDAADLSLLAPIPAGQSVNVVFLRPGRTLKSQHMVFNEDYFYSRQELTEYLKFMLNIIPLPSVAELTGKKRGAPTPRDSTPHSAVKVSVDELLAASNGDKKRKVEDAPESSSSSSSSSSGGQSSSISSLVNVMHEDFADKSLGECLESARQALHQDRLNPLLFSTSSGSNAIQSTGYVRQETLDLYETICTSLKQARGTCVYVWGSTGQGKTLAVTSILAQLRHNRAVTLGVLSEATTECEASAPVGSPLRRTESRSSTDSDSPDNGIDIPQVADWAADCGFSVVSLNSCKDVFEAIACRLNLFEKGNKVRKSAQSLVLEYFKRAGRPVDASHTAPSEASDLVVSSKRSRLLTDTVPMTVLVLDEINMAINSEVCQLLQLINTHPECSLILIATCNNQFTSYLQTLRKAVPSSAVDFRHVVTFAPLSSDKLVHILQGRGCGLFDKGAVKALVTKGNGKQFGDVRMFLEECSRVLKAAETQLREGKSPEALEAELAGPSRAIVSARLALAKEDDAVVDMVNRLNVNAQLLLVALLVRRVDERKNVKYGLSELAAMFSTEAAGLRMDKAVDDMGVNTVLGAAEDLVIHGLAKKVETNKHHSQSRYYVTVSPQAVVQASQFTSALKEVVAKFIRDRSRFRTEDEE